MRRTSRENWLAFFEMLKHLVNADIIGLTTDDEHKVLKREGLFYQENNRCECGTLYCDDVCEEGHCSSFEPNFKFGKIEIRWSGTDPSTCKEFPDLHHNDFRKLVADVTALLKMRNY